VPIVPEERGDQRQLGDRWFQVVCYETDGRRNLADAIGAAEPVRRAMAAASVLRALPGWRESAGPGLVALPADIVLAHRPLLLPLPAWGPPPLRQVLGEAERAAHLTPEEARGIPSGERNPDLHALGIAALSCFETLPDDETGRLLQRTACSAVFGYGRRDSRLPTWMHRVEAIRIALEQLGALTGVWESGTASWDPRCLADALDVARRAMDPLMAVQSLRGAKEPRRAVGLAHAALASQPSYELLILAADIADRDLDEPLEALSLLDRAAQLEPRRDAAHITRLRILASLWPADRHRRVASADASFTERLSRAAYDAFDHLSRESRDKHAHEMAHCLIELGDLREASKFVHRWLHDGDTLVWWHFDLMLDYGEIFLRLGDLDAAAQVLDAVRTGLRHSLEIGQITRRKAHQHGLRLAELDRRLLEARNGDDTA
jgi:tetratricopeptide (TPR) repeat protein